VDEVRNKIYKQGDTKKILDSLQIIFETPDINFKTKSNMFLKKIEEMYGKAVESVINDMVPKLKEYNNKLLETAPPEFKTDYKTHIASINQDIIKLAEMDKNTSLTTDQKDKIRNITVTNKKQDAIMQILGSLERISKTDESLKKHVRMFIVTIIMSELKIKLTALNEEAKIPNLTDLEAIIDGTPSVTQLGGVKEKNNSKKNKRSNKRKTKRRKGANSKKIKFTR